MQVEIQEVGPCKKLLKIEVPPEKVSEELDKTYQQLNENVVVPGFRRGHVPRWLMESRFGKQVNDDAKDALVTGSFDEAIKEKELKPIGTPKFDDDIAFEPGKPLAFGVTIEVRPEFEIDNYTALELKKPSVQPTKTEIEKRIELIRRRYAKLEQVAEGSPKPQDVVLCNITLREGDTVYREIPSHQFIVADHVLVGLTLDETTALVTSAKVGESVEKTIKLPEQYPDEPKRGAEMTLALKLEGIRRPILPKLTEEWAKEIGFDSVEEVHKEVETTLTHEKEREAQLRMEEQLADQVLKKVDFQLPEDVVTSMAERALIRRSLSLRQQGIAPEEIERQLETLKAESRSSVEKEAKLYFILEKIADKERLFVTEDEVNARVEAIAANYGRSPDQMYRELEQGGRLSELRSSLREEKVKAFLIEKADVKETKRSSSKKAEDKDAATE